MKGDVRNGLSTYQKYSSNNHSNNDDEKVAVAFIDKSQQSSADRKPTRRPSLFMAITGTFVGYFAMGSLLIAIYSVMAFINPFLLKLVH